MERGRTEFVFTGTIPEIRTFELKTFCYYTGGLPDNLFFLKKFQSNYIPETDESIPFFRNIKINKILEAKAIINFLLPFMSV